MKERNHIRKHTSAVPHERGSALLVSLMVMVGLSLLGLGFVASSETESAISVNQRNYVQVLAIAEAGAKTAVDWFQDPDDLDNMGILPANNNVFKRERFLPAGTNIGRYKPAGGTYLFDKPFKGTIEDKLYGDEEHADVFIDRNTSQGRTFLDNLNTALFGSTAQGELTEILVYAPPIIGGTVNADGFWEGGIRYGLATIKATATKFADPGTRSRVLARRSVKIVVSEWPFPGPQGPIQSNANITTGGNYGVHWGKMTSQGTMEIKRALKSIPWFNAHERVHFERGYNDVLYPLGTGEFWDQHDWLTEIVERNYEDPWYEARARGDITNPIAPALVPGPFVKDDLSNDVELDPKSGWSNWFQEQAFTSYPNYLEVIFPRIDYDFWKEIALQGVSSGQEGVYYLRPTGGENYTDGTATKNFAKWTNTNRAVNPAKAGFYFFDTMNGLSPQGPGAPGILAPPIDVNSSDDGPTFGMMGFIYLNAESFGSSGISPPAQWVNFPGEPYRDVGFQFYDEITFMTPIAPPPGQGAGNGRWDFQDVNGNGVFDVWVEEVTRARPSGGSVTFWRPVPYTPGCSVLVDCSEPHEPYLNIVYPTEAKFGGGPREVRAEWEPNGSQTRRPKRRPGGVTPSCTDPANYSICTSNGYDRDGGMVNDLFPMLNGVMYIEGDFGDTTGNADYFGSLLVNGNVSGTGTPEVWFDERLIKGDWPPPEFNFPRVYISAHLTDQ
ncbi:MAG TPA: pilus assembly PilX N-terminal domain-containing protein [Thermoanaerobaculia bacterium]|nr:pilus assembly PilX N-terminal domain-containing protein [Thermoanaerobaculia bacterium]